MARLANKVLIITGAGNGMGKAMAIRFAQEGAKVLASDRDEAWINATVKEITDAGGTAVADVTDVSDEAAVKTLIHRAVKEFGRLDILVNNAGIPDNFKTVVTATDETWDRVLKINLYAPFWACREAVSIMNTQSSGGVILNVSSVGGLYGALGGAAYVASKHGVIGLTKNIAATYGVQGKVRANALAPGTIQTNIRAAITDPDPMGDQALRDAGGYSGPQGTGEDMANAALYLVSDEAKFVNGAVLVADGGWTAY
ncbi:SDR family NAD(P)-dependent oxidoreductase [Schleiferilactobacillus perolens]|jgi:NAD(P)-dependent dehydrogenase (short-subunit alcohol dehydrogenase family)|uniref:Short-chain dehydrogenase reductase SDR n=1 Tax=Schleiferilactobacillus perolens DSM 12744 TaxID=1423792 RepID=A0A0R1N327_9LACO|nr:SDR family oxidoreductase [Schleiferilactobacillus perolens]KRL12756.1 short-chain dehydrogenase reductase SDR [Schleiferilactobacillus perolens DSM 12744]MCI2171342.1 SDR family oxidoreductase [Schleiferilactobacillus perolens]